METKIPQGMWYSAVPPSQKSSPYDDPALNAAIKDGSLSVEDEMPKAVDGSPLLNTFYNEPKSQSKGVYAKLKEEAGVQKAQHSAFAEHYFNGRKKNSKVCKTCGTEEVASLQWKNINNARTVYSNLESPKDMYCLVCQCNTEVVSKEEFKIDDEEES